MITKKNKIKKNKISKKILKKHILKGGDITFKVIKDEAEKNIKKINSFIERLYKYELYDKCDTLKIRDYFTNDLDIKDENNLNDLEISKFYKAINEEKEREIKVTNPFLHGGIKLNEDSMTVPKNCIICFSTLINNYGVVPEMNINEYFSYNKFIKNMGIKELKSLIQNFSLYSDINNIKHKAKFLREDDNFMTTFNNCFLNTVWYFPDQQYPHIIVRTDEESFEYSQTFNLHSDGKHTKNFYREKIEYEKGRHLTEVIENTRIKGDSKYNIFFFNLCRYIVHDEKAPDNIGKENTLLNEELKYEFYMYYLNLEVIKQLKKEIRGDISIEYGNSDDEDSAFSYCSHISVGLSNVNYNLNEYNKTYFTKNYCFNRNNVFLDMFFNKILINHELLENEYEQELLYFLSLSIFKQFRFIILLKKHFYYEKNKFRQIMSIMIKKINKISINRYKNILENYSYSSPDTIEVLDYFNDLYSYINIIINIIEEKDITLSIDNTKNILELKNDMKLVPQLFNDESLKQLFIIGDYGNSIKIFYNKKTHNENFLDYLDDYDIQNLILINVPNLFNTLKLIDSDIDVNVNNLKIIYDTKLPGCYYNYNNTLDLSRFNNLKFLSLFNLNLSNTTNINSYLNLEELIINNSEISTQCEFNITINKLESIDLNNINVSFTDYSSIQFTKLIFNNILINDSLTEIKVKEITFINFTEWDKITKLDITDNLVIKDCILDLLNFKVEIEDVNMKTVYFGNINFNSVGGRKYLIDLPKKIETLVITECNFSDKNKIKFRNPKGLNIDTLLINECNEIIEIEFEKNIIVKKLIIENCNKLKKISLPNVGRFLGNKKYNINSIEIINVPLLKIKRNIANFYNSKKNGNIPINNII